MRHSICMVPLIILVPIIILALGLNVQARFDTNRLAAEVDFSLFGLFNLVKFRVFVWKDEVYYRLNRSGVKKLNLKGAETPEIEGTKRKFKPVFPKPPLIRLNKVTVNLNINDGENALVPIFSTLAARGALANMELLTKDFLRIKHKKITVFPANSDTGFKIHIAFKPGYNVFIIILYFLRMLTLSVKERYLPKKTKTA